MKQAQFISLMSACLRVEEKTIKKTVRTLREAGLFTTGARGVNAPDMTPLDAVRVFIAAVASASPMRSVNDVKYFGKMVPALSGEVPDDTAALGINGQTTLEQFLVSVVENKAPEDACLYGELHVGDDGRASVSVESNQYILQQFYFEEGWKAASALGHVPHDGGIQRSGSCPLMVLHEIGFEMIGWEVD